MKIRRMLYLALLTSLLMACASSPQVRERYLIPESVLYQDHSFIALQYYAGIWNRRVKVYVLNDMLSIAKIGGEVASPLFATGIWYNPSFYIDPSYQTQYANLDPKSEEFLSIDRANYQIKRSEIKKIEFDPTDKWGMGAVPHTGKILVSTLNGDVHEFILLGSQNGSFVKRMIEEDLKLENH